MADAISIEETNRIRVSLGMKPLPVPGGATGPIFKEASSTVPVEDEGSTLESRQAEGYDNYRKVQEAELAKKKRDAKNEAIKKARDAAKRFAKLEGKGLGDADGDEDDDAKSWLIKQKKRQKEIEKARKREKELAEAEAAEQYTAKDLAGVKVGHELDTFEEGEEQVLTLKDTTIDENEEEGDELENLDLREREKLKEKLELKKKKPVYNPNDDDDGTQGILAHYDEEIDGKKQGKRFTLDGMGSTTEAVSQGGGIVQKAKAKAFSLDLFKDDEPKSDYLDISEIKVKKPKKSKKSRSTRQKAVDEDDIFPAEVADVPAENGMDVDQPVVMKKRTYEDISFVDDDDLQASLAASRRTALKKRQKLRPEEIVQRMTEQAAEVTEIEEAEGGLVIDETSEFVANLQKPTAPVSKRRSVSRQPDAVTAMDVDSDNDEDVNMAQAQSYANIEDEEDLAARLKREESASFDVDNGLEQEATLERGLGSTLKLLRDRRILQTDDSTDLNDVFRRKQLFLAEKQRQEAEAEKKARAQRERDRATGRLDRMSAREKEDYARSQNNFRDQQESRQLAEHFNKSYKPNVELKYHDEHGRSLNQKEAFKHLSHQFHGKGSGKQKTEKLLKKIEDEKRREAQSTLDGSQMGGMSNATVQQSKKQRTAGVRLA